MLLGLNPMFCFEILVNFGEKLKKGEPEKSGQNWLLSRSVGNLRRGVVLCHSVGCIVAARPKCPKGHPSGTPRLSFAKPIRRATSRRCSATSRRSYCSQRANFGFLFRKSSFCMPIV